MKLPLARSLLWSWRAWLIVFANKRIFQNSARPADKPSVRTGADGAARARTPGLTFKERMVSLAINTNIAALHAQEYLRVNSDFQAKTINRVTSGLRIVSSGDDAAG